MKQHILREANYILPLINASRTPLDGLTNPQETHAPRLSWAYI